LKVIRVSQLSYRVDNLESKVRNLGIVLSCHYFGKKYSICPWKKYQNVFTFFASSGSVTTSSIDPIYWPNAQGDKTRTALATVAGVLPMHMTLFG